jgi:hypothetical protein
LSPTPNPSPQSGVSRCGPLNQNHAGLRNETAASWVDLHALLPADFISSEARHISHSGGVTYVIGYGHNLTLNRDSGAAIRGSLRPTTRH